MVRRAPAILVFREWHDDRFAAGVTEVSHACGWQTHFTDRRGGHTWNTRLRFAGAILRTESHNGLPEPLIDRLDLPNLCVVNGTPYRHPDLGRVWAHVLQDDAQIGRLALRHLHGRGHRDVAYFNRVEGFPAWQRSEAFRQEAAILGCRVHDLRGDLADASAWLPAALAGLPAPLAVMTENDDVGVSLAYCCQEQGILVPERLAIIGVEDDPLLCLHNDPPLSSVDGNPHEWGRQSALHLDRLLRCLDPPAKPILVPPIGVAARRSSERIIAGNPAVAQALALLRTHRHEHHVNVGDLLADCGLSRAALYRAFTRLVGHPPVEELQRMRLEDACLLLTTTDKTLHEIADQCGFTDASHLCRLFLDHFDTSPGDYRRSRRSGRHVTDRLSTA